MIYPSKFRSLVSKIRSMNDQHVQFIGQGNPCAQILLVGKDCPIDRSTTRGEGCYEMEYLHNTVQWEKNITTNKEPEEVIDWVETRAIGEDKYNPLYPYRGQHNIKAERTKEGELLNGGASSSWCAYQKLADKIFHYPSPALHIDFHQHTFLTALSSINSPVDSCSDEVSQCVDTRCNILFRDPFFRSFPITIIASGRFVKDYHINIEDVFNQKFSRIEEEGKDWVRIYKNDERLLLLTRPIALCSDVLLDKIADLVQLHLEKPLMKYCLYYDGSDESCENTKWGFYERHWIHDSVRTSNQAFQYEVKDMIHQGISEDWIDSFGIPRTLVGIFFNRYCHWVGLYDINDFKNWFEGVRNKMV